MQSTWMLGRPFYVSSEVVEDGDVLVQFLSQLDTFRLKKLLVQSNEVTILILELYLHSLKHFLQHLYFNVFGFDLFLPISHYLFNLDL